MGFSWVFAVIFYFFLGCEGFLLDDKTKPATTSSALLTDENYNALFNLIVHERQSRAKLEQQLARLERELTATQQGVTDIYHTSTDNNATLETQAKNWNILRTECKDLKTENNLLKMKVDSLDRKHSHLENYTNVLKQELTSLQQLKGITHLQTVLNVRNETTILRKELKITNNSLNSLRNDAEARKQDFVALLNKADSTEQKLEFSIMAFDDKLEYQENQTKLVMKLMQDEMQKFGTYQNQTFKHIEENLTAVEGIQNVSVGKLELEIHNMSNRAALTVCAKYKSYSSGDYIIFPYVKTRYGVSNSTVSALGNSGKFKCEKAGLYLLSASLTTNTKTYVQIQMHRNNGEQLVLIAFPEITGYSYRTNTFSFLQHLNMHDILYMQADTTATIYGNQWSCISFLQLTN